MLSEFSGSCPGAMALVPRGGHGYATQKLQPRWVLPLLFLRCCAALRSAGGKLHHPPLAGCACRAAPTQPGLRSVVWTPSTLDLLSFACEEGAVIAPSSVIAFSGLVCEKPLPTAMKHSRPVRSECLFETDCGENSSGNALPAPSRPPLLFFVWLFIRKHLTCT